LERVIEREGKNNLIPGPVVDRFAPMSIYLNMMKNFLACLLIAAVLFSCKQKDITEQEVMNAIKKFDYGWEHKDLKTVDSVLSPAYVYFTQSGGTFSRDSVVATAGENTYTLQNMSRTEFVVTLYGNTAVVSTRWKGRGTYRGTPFDEDQRCSVVLVKKDNKVEILSEHCTPVRTNHIFH
jgi:hypothetical protein